MSPKLVHLRNLQLLGAITILGALLYIIQPVGVFPSSTPNILFENINLLLRRTPDDSEVHHEGETKIILAWTKFFSVEITHGRWMAKCLDYNCRITSDRSRLSTASAVLFHFHSRNFNWSNVPEIRHDWQRYVLMLLESPSNTRNQHFDAEPGFFNWTQTYRLDSDIPMPYGGIEPGAFSFNRTLTTDLTEVAAAKQLNTLLQIVSGKSCPIVWFVSNCNSASGRERYIAELRKHIELHQYGACGVGWTNCTKKDNRKCTDLLERDYYFYIAAENSICRDYITEKLWGRLNKWSVPIVMKRSLYSEILPADAFVAFDDYNSPAEMATHLKDLIQNSTEYLKYFSWKFQTNLDIKFFSDFRQSRHHGLCLLCKQLWAPEVPKKHLFNLTDWWFREADCDSSLVPRLLHNLTHKV